MQTSSLSPKGLGISLALIGALGMLLLSIVGLAGYGQEAISIMQAHHVGYNLSFLGIIIGVVEAALASYVGGWLIATLHNKYA